MKMAKGCTYAETADKLGNLQGLRSGYHLNLSVPGKIEDLRWTPTHSLPQVATVS
jgi:hypothetical protein